MLFDPPSFYLFYFSYACVQNLKVTCFWIVIYDVFRVLDPFPFPSLDLCLVQNLFLVQDPDFCRAPFRVQVLCHVQTPGPVLCLDPVHDRDLGLCHGPCHDPDPGHDRVLCRGPDLCHGPFHDRGLGRVLGLDRAIVRNGLGIYKLKLLFLGSSSPENVGWLGLPAP
jgi:hypothetical protein